MNYDEQQKMLTELIFVNEQLKSNINQLQELKNIDIIISNIKALKHINVEQVNSKIETLDFTKLIDSISIKVENKLDNAIQKIEDKSTTLSDKLQNFDIATEGLSDIDTIAESIKDIARDSKTVNRKILFTVAFTVAIATAVVSFGASNFNKLFTETIPNEAKFKKFVSNPKFTTIESDSSSIFLSVPSNLKIDVMKDLNNKEIQYIRFKK